MHVVVGGFSCNSLPHPTAAFFFFLADDHLHLLPFSLCHLPHAASPRSPQVLATLTQDIGKILSAISKCTIGGQSDLLTSLNVASLALKHRENKNQRQRIVCFVGSPLATSGETGAKGVEDALIKLGKKLKKNNVAVDVIVFGDEGIACEESLRKFVEAVQSADNR
jgi:26S proteasome regulatory subunit N10